MIVGGVFFVLDLCGERLPTCERMGVETKSRLCGKIHCPT